MNALDSPLPESVSTQPTASFGVIVVAAGQSSRFRSETTVRADQKSVRSIESRKTATSGSGRTPDQFLICSKKPFALLANKPVWLHSVEKFLKRDDVRQLIVVVAPDDLVWFREYYAEEIDRLLPVVVGGGSRRTDSVRNALAAIRSDVDFVAVHDAARPCVSEKTIDEVFGKARSHGAAMPAAPIVGTIKRVRDGRIEETVARDDLWEAQTPQVFRRTTLAEAYDRQSDAAATDDAQMVERIGCPVFIVPSDRRNLKITTQTDLMLAEMFISEK